MSSNPKSRITKVDPFWKSVADKIERSPEAWQHVAEGLWHSAQTLQGDSDKAYRTYRMRINDGSARIRDRDDPAFQKWQVVQLRYEQWRTASMLRAMAIECYMKMLHYRKHLVEL